MAILDQKQKKELVIALLKEGKTFREIQRLAHVDPDFIGKVERDTFGDGIIMYLKIQGLSSKNTQAISLFRDGKKKNGSSIRFRYGFHRICYLAL